MQQRAGARARVAAGQQAQEEVLIPGEEQGAGGGDEGRGAEGDEGVGEEEEEEEARGHGWWCRVAFL